MMFFVYLFQEIKVNSDEMEEEVPKAAELFLVIKKCTKIKIQSLWSQLLCFMFLYTTDNVLTSIQALGVEMYTTTRCATKPSRLHLLFPIMDIEKYGHRKMHSVPETLSFECSSNGAKTVGYYTLLFHA